MIVGNPGQYSGRTHDKNRTDKHHQDYRKTAGELFHTDTQVIADNFRDTQTVEPEGYHPGQIIVNRTAKYGTEYDPEKCGRPPHRSGHSAKDGTQPGNVQKLYQKNLGPGHGNIIYPVLRSIGRGLPVHINAEDPFDNPAVNEITQ